MNKLKHSSENFLINLKQNAAHKLAMSHSMVMYNKNALYSFIPKNACSTLRLSIAIENGCISGVEQGHWIHANNSTFNASLGEAIKADYTFTILRCPFRRLASVYLDKFISKEPEAWQYRNLLGRTVELDDLTFEDFVTSLKNPKAFNSNIHWKPQVSFLLYEEYSDYFSLEHFQRAVTTLKQKIDFDVIDARKLTNHGTNQFKVVNDECFSNTPAFEISVMKRRGECPSHASLYNDNLIEVVKELYKKDFDLYAEKLGKGSLLF